jgi:hypothetical protein
VREVEKRTLWISNIEYARYREAEFARNGSVWNRDGNVSNRRCKYTRTVGNSVLEEKGTGRQNG